MLGLSVASAPSVVPELRSRMWVASYTLVGFDGASSSTAIRTVTTTSAAAIFQWRWRIFR